MHFYLYTPVKVSDYKDRTSIKKQKEDDKPDMKIKVKIKTEPISLYLQIHTEGFLSSDEETQLLSTRK